MKQLLLALSVAAFVLTGCNGDDPVDPVDPAAPATGTWRGGTIGDLNGDSFTATTTLALLQNGTTVTGAWDGSAVEGTFDGTTLNLNLLPFTEEGVNFTGGVTATYSDGQFINMAGTLTGATGAGQVTGTFTAPSLTRDGGASALAIPSEHPALLETLARIHTLSSRVTRP
jgi:hypothetical protein